MGQLAAFMDALVGLEESADSEHLTVYRWRPVQIETPAVYNWILPSPSDIPATTVVVDTMNFAVRVVVDSSDIDEEELSAEGYFDVVRDTLDRDLIVPSKSVLNVASHETRRTTTRTLTDAFNEIPYLALELVLQAKFRRYFTPT